MAGVEGVEGVDDTVMILSMVVEWGVKWAAGYMEANGMFQRV